MRYAARRDENEPEIVKALEALGASVQRLSAKGVPDLVVGYLGVNYLIEVKDPSKDGKLDAYKRRHNGLRKSQVEWHGAWLGQVAVAASIADAYDVLGIPEEERKHGHQDAP